MKNTRKKQARKVSAEPKNRRSAEWRRWKLREFRRRFLSPDRTPEEYAAAWDEFRELFEGLRRNEDFWHVYHALRLLPALLTSRQELDELYAQGRREAAALKAAETRRKRAAA